MGVLEDILAQKRREVDKLLEDFEPDVTLQGTPCDVPRLLRRSSGEPLRLICEHKPKSPSAGTLSSALSPKARAIAYADAGATMVSVLTDGPFFGGGFEHLREVHLALRNHRRIVGVLAKEFVIDPVQIAVARFYGADAILLIARIVSDDVLRRLVKSAYARAVEPIVEVTTEAELERALSVDARTIGVNARDLDTLAIDRARAARLIDAIPSDRIALSFSGVRSPDDVRALRATRADGVLIGEALMREDDPRSLLAAMVEAAAR